MGSKDKFIVNGCSILNALIFMALNGLFIGYYSYFLLKIPSSEYDFTIKVMIATLIIYGILSIQCILRLFTAIIFCGQTMTEEEFEIKMYLNSWKIKYIFYSIARIHSICCMILIPKFIPYTHKNCHNYSYGFCIIGRINAFFGMFVGIIFGLFVSIAFCACCFCGVNICSKIQTENNTPPPIQNNPPGGLTVRPEFNFLMRDDPDFANILRNLIPVPAVAEVINDPIPVQAVIINEDIETGKK